MVTRVKIAEFGIIQKVLANAVVTFYKPNADGSNSGDKVDIYQDATGTDQTENPQTLDECGQLRVDCYVESDVLASITGINSRTERRLKKIKQNPFEYSLPVTSTNFYFSNISGSNNTAIAAAAQAQASQAAAAASAFNAASSETDAAQSAANAATSEANALAHANNAAQSASEFFYREIVDISAADSPFTPTAGQEGYLFRADATTGNIIVNLSSLAAYGEDMKFSFVKIDGGPNSVTINRGGGNTINDQNSIVLDSKFELNSLLGDQSSGTWLNIVQSSDILNRSITGGKIALATILGENIANLTLTFDKLATSAFATTNQAIQGVANNKLMRPDTTRDAIKAASPFVEKCAHFQYRAPFNSNAGVMAAYTGNFPLTTERIRPINTELMNDIPGLVLNGSILEMPAGTFFFDIEVHNYATNYFRTVLRNLDAATAAEAFLLRGIEGYSRTAGEADPATTPLRGRVVLAAQTDIQLNQAIDSNANAASAGGLGSGSNGFINVADNVNLDNIYTDIKIWQLD